VRRFVLIFLVALNSALAAEPTLNYTNMSVAQLIDDLVNIDAEAPGLHSTAWVRGFIAEEHPPVFAGGVIGSSAPTTFPQMRELVRRGVGALPLLIKHLDDKRTTKLTVGGDFFTFAYFSDEYDPKGRTRSERGSDSDRLSDPKHQVHDRKYRVRVGDVCYALVGQVVNRSLLPVRYQPTAGLVVNSPIEEPSLTQQVRRDWGDIDATGHMGSLLSDAQTEKDDWSYGPALQRLRFYYPEEYQRQSAGALKKKIQKFESSEKKRR
jgi:hypothetical protein